MSQPFSETGASGTHRDEAGRLAAIAHDTVSHDFRGHLSVEASLQLALLHAALAIADELHALRHGSEKSA